MLLCLVFDSLVYLVDAVWSSEFIQYIYNTANPIEWTRTAP